MPYPTEHAARFHEPRGFKRFRRENDKLGDGVDVIYGIKPDGSTTVQAVRFKADRWTYAQAAEWLKEHRKELGKPIQFDQARGAEEGPPPPAPAGDRAAPAAETAPAGQLAEVASPEELHAGFTKIVRWLNTPWSED